VSCDCPPARGHDGRNLPCIHEFRKTVAERQAREFPRIGSRVVRKKHPEYGTGTITDIQAGNLPWIVTWERDNTRVGYCVDELLPAAAHDPMVQLTKEDQARNGSWMQTRTGVSFYPLDPRASEINIEDVAHGLAMCCRYGGQCREFYSVAEHCVRVSEHVPQQYAREGLLHDLSEAYIGDMIRPLKHTPEMAEFRKAEAAIEVCAADAFALDTSPEAHTAVKRVDDRILLDEITQLQHTPAAYLQRMDTKDKPPLGITLKCWPPARAKRRFMYRFTQLFNVKVPWWKRLWWKYA
jgi:hypothetical protein